MRVRIEARPGELESRANDVIRVIRELAGTPCEDHDHLSKSETPKSGVQFEFTALAGSARNAREKHVNQIREAMLSKISGVLDRG